jgi:hypothetical protein
MRARIALSAVLPTIGVLGLALVACDNRGSTPSTGPRITPPSPEARAKVPTSYVSVSDSNPAPDSTIVVAGNAAVVDTAHGITSFRASLQYDAAALEYIEEVPLPGMMRALNAQPGRVIVGGASSSPTSDPRLFALRFRVRGALRIGMLNLVVDELNDATYASQVKSLVPMASLRVDPMLARASPARLR